MQLLESLVEFIRATTPESEEKTLPKNPDAEDLELRNIQNATERHLLEYERSCNESVLTLVGLDLSLSLGLNSAVTWLLLNTLQTLTPDFTGLTFHFLNFSLNTFGTLPYLASDKVNKKYLLPLTLARVALSYTVNGKIIGTIDNRVNSSLQSYKELKTEIRDYENAYKQNKNKCDGFCMPGLNEIFILAISIVFVIIGNKIFFNKGDNTPFS